MRKTKNEKKKKYYCVEFLLIESFFDEFSLFTIYFFLRGDFLTRYFPMYFFRSLIFTTRKFFLRVLSTLHFIFLFFHFRSFPTHFSHVFFPIVNFYYSRIFLVMDFFYTSVHFFSSIPIGSFRCVFFQSRVFAFQKFYCWNLTHN